jgi:hypothetical protein
MEQNININLTEQAYKAFKQFEDKKIRIFLQGVG